MKPLKLIMSAIVLFGIVGAIAYLESTKPGRPAKESASDHAEIVLPAPAGATSTTSSASLGPSYAEKIKTFPRAKEIVDPSGFINTIPFKLSDYVGKKVILVDFWTYSCINCIRTTPYLNAWYQKYKDQGLLIVGVHTPEFGFEHDYNNVAQAVKDEGIEYPVVLDNNYGTWDAYQNRYWPRKYLIDIDGFIRYDQVGEGSYDVTEKQIQTLLAERVARLGVSATVAQGVTHPQEAIQMDASQPVSQETYFGATRNEFLGNGARGITGSQTLTYVSSSSEPGLFYLSGDWHFENEYTENQSQNAEITYTYRAKNVYFVASADQADEIEITQDGHSLGTAAGSDVKTSSDGTATMPIQASRLYKVITNPSYGEHTLRIKIKNPGLKAFTFTFG